MGESIFHIHLTPCCSHFSSSNSSSSSTTLTPFLSLFSHLPPSPNCCFSRLYQAKSANMRLPWSVSPKAHRVGPSQVSGIEGALISDRLTASAVVARLLARSFRSPKSCSQVVYINIEECLHLDLEL